MKRIWSQERIIDTLRQLHKRGKDLSYNHLARTMQSLVSAAAYYFGSYRKAVAKAGIDYAQVTRRPRWTRQRIIQLVKQASRKGEDLYWAAVTRREDELGKAAFASLQRRLFGNWDSALRAAGLDPERVSRYRRWGRENIIAQLKKRSRAGKPLNSGAIQREDAGFHAAAVRHFGAYDKALRAAGLNPEKLRQRRRWTSEDVVRELRAFKKKHGQISDAELRRNAPALYGASLRFFGTLTKARKAVE